MRKIASLFSVLMLLSALAFAQTKSISGKVRDDQGKPVPGATIQIKGTNLATVSDANGDFSINAKEGSTLVVSYVGYESQSFRIGSASELMVSLKATEQSLTEVVVTATQVRRNRNDVVYANQTVKNEELNSVTNRSALNALQGKVAGVKISQSSGAPGASTRVVLRGETSLTQGNNALIVVDGVPLNNSSSSGGGGTGKAGDRDNYVDFGNRANDINPDDIESMTVLKGPAATSLFGSRGASGVILITTKKGGASSGKPRISVGSSFSVDHPYILLKRQDRFGSGYKSCNGCGGGIDIFMGENFGWGAELDGRMIPWTAIPADDHGHLLPLTNGKIEQLSRPYSAVDKHLQSFFDDGYTLRNNVSIEGGVNRFKYFVSYTNFNNAGVIPNTRFNKNNVLVNVTSNLTDKLVSTFSFNYTKLDQRGATEGGYPFGYSSGTPAYSFALQTPVNIPFRELRNYNSPYHDFRGFYGQYSINPYFILAEQKVKNSVDNLIANVGLSYSPIKGLTLTGRASTNYNISGVTENNPRFVYTRALSWSDGELSDFESPRENQSLGGYKESLAKSYLFNYDLLANYAKQINEDFKLDITAGYNSVETRTNLTSGQTVGGLVIPGYYHLSNSKENALAVGNSTLYRIFGGYLNTSVGFRNMLFLEYSMRNDWSSTLPDGSRSFFYQAGGLSFVPTNYFDIKNQYLSYLKFRGNVGSTGKDAPLYRLNNTFVANPIVLNYADDYQITLPFNGQPGTHKANLIGNPSLKPELSVTYEVGADIGLLNNRVNVEYTYYHTTSKDQIVDVNLPWSSGYAFTTLNVGETTNRGHELAIKATPVKNKLITWDVFFAWSTNSNRVVKIAEGLDELNIFAGLVHFAGHGSLNLVAAKGLPFGTFKGTDYVYDPSGKLVVDGTGNPLQSSEQRYLGNYQPKYITSLSTDFRIKGFTLHLLADAKQGGLFYSGTKLSTEFNGTASTTIINNRTPFVIENSVTQDGTGYKANTKETSAYNYLKALPASAYLIDASYLKLREASLNYSFSPKLLTSLPFASLSVGVFGKNLYFWLPDSNTFADPEVGGVGGASDAQGVETSTTPPLRSYGVELRLTLK